MKRYSMKYLSVVFLLFFALSLKAQGTNFNSQRNWSLNKKEILFGLGATQFLGDLGGKDKIGTDYSLVDLDWPSTVMGGMVGYRYRFHPYFSTTTSIHFGLLKGDDAKTEDVARKNRNLSFRSPVADISQRLEFIFLAREKFGARYKVRGLKFVKDKNFQMYGFGGVGINYFNPQAKYDGKWYNLRPLKTEGQGMEGGAKPYKPYTLTIPMGVGIRFGISKMWRIGVEATYVKTFTDYMDDVSGVYYDPSKLGSPEAAYLSNPSLGPGYEPGQQRGDKQNDAYFYLNLVAYKNITYKSKSKARKKETWRGGRYKF
jgi:hypothetical protein